jgi:hypothetical protein
VTGQPVRLLYKIIYDKNFYSHINNCISDIFSIFIAIEKYQKPGIKKNQNVIFIIKKNICNNFNFSIPACQNAKIQSTNGITALLCGG